MRTFAQKPKVTQQTTPPKTTTPPRPHLGHSHEVNSILHLQRTIGNQAVQRLLHSSSEERNTKLTGVTSPHFGHDFSRIPIHPPAAGAIQSRIEPPSSEDKYETEADRIAGQVMAMSGPRLQHDREIDTPVLESTQAATLDRTNAHRTKLASGGSALPGPIKSFYEPRMGLNLSNVKLHRDREADTASGAIGARAFAYENHVWLSPRVSGSPNFTIAHEFAHIAQWQAGAPAVIRPDIFDESLVRQLTASDFVGLDADTVERLVEALSAYVDNFPEGSNDRLAVQNNLDLASAALAAMTTSTAEPAPAPVARTTRSVRDDTPNPETLRRDVQRIMTLVQEWHVSDDEEREILAIVERYATSPGRFDAFLQAMSNRHYWGGLFGERFRPGITAILQELEGRRGRRFRELLLTRSRQEHFRSYQPAHELTFGESFWHDLSEGQIRDQIFAYFQGMGAAGVAMAESIVQLITDPAGFAEGIARLPETIAGFWRNRSEIWRSFMAASPTEQARMIGRIFGEAELFLASYGAGSAATPARGAQALAPARAVQVVGGGQAALTMAAGGALELGHLGPAASMLTQMTAHTAQAGSGGQSMRDAGESAEARSSAPRRERGASRRSPEPEHGAGAEGAQRPHERPGAEGARALPREVSRQPIGEEIWNEINLELELDAPATTRLESTAGAAREAEASGLVGTRGTPGTVDLGVQPHRAASQVREGFGITGRQAQSAHIGPTSFLHRVLGYSRSAAETVLLDPATHRAFDNHWKNWAMAQRRLGRTRCTAGELFDVMLEAVDQIPGLPQRTKNALAWRMDLEFFRDLGLRPATELDLPYANIRPAAVP